MLLDETYHIVVLLLWWLKTTLAIACDNELVASHSLPMTVHLYIRRIAQAISFVQLIACVHQQLLYVQTLQEIIICQFVVCHKRIPL